MRAFAESALRLSGFAMAVLGWSADQFWAATPAELAAVVAALIGAAGDVPPPDRDTLARLKEAFPDE